MIYLSHKSINSVFSELSNSLSCFEMKNMQLCSRICRRSIKNDFLSKFYVFTLVDSAGGGLLVFILPKFICDVSGDRLDGSNFCFYAYVYSAKKIIQLCKKTCTANNEICVVE